MRRGGTALIGAGAALRRDRPRPPWWRRAVVCIRHRRDLRVRRRPRRRLRHRRADRDAGSCTRSATARRKDGRSASTPGCGPRATKVRWHARSTASVATSNDGRRRGSSRHSRKRGSSAATPQVGERFVALAHEFVYRDPFPEEWRREVRRMKARIERERIPPGEDPQFHLKLGRGSLSDIEFTVQLEQLAHGGAQPEVREPSTLRALDALVAIGAITPEDATQLRESFVLCERAAELPVPADGFTERRAPRRWRRRREARPAARLHPPAPAVAPRRLPAGHPPGPDDRRADLLRPSRRVGPDE